MRRLHAVAVATAVWVAVAATACGGAKERATLKKSDGTQADPSPPGDDTRKDAPAGAAPKIDQAAAAAGLMGALARLGEPGYWDEPKEGPEARSSSYHAVVELGGNIVEREGFDWLGSSTGTPMRTIALRLFALAGDDDVKSILLRVGDLGLSMAQAEELHDTLLAVRKQKPVHCFTDGVSDTTYRVLAACETIGLTPLGEIAVIGPSLEPLYLRGLLDKLGVQADFLHVGAFKGAAEPLTRDAPSPEMRETYEGILAQSFQSTVAALVSGRKLDEAKARAIVDEGLFPDEAAKQAGLVDAIATWEVWRDEKSGKAWKKVKLEKDKAGDLGAIMEMLGAAPRKKIEEPHIALIYAVGNVVDGRGDGLLSRGAEIAPRWLVPALRAAAADDSVKAVVLRIDSPGGSALASETIWHAVDELKAKKPVVVSMGSLAASGGYYIACGATTIFAEPTTLTGSIGVVGGKIVLGPALRSIGVTSVELGKGKRANIMSPMRKWTADERGAIEGSMKSVYTRFIARVAAGRGKKPEEIEPIAQGRVWVGTDAKARGLVDSLGGLDAALADARARAKLPDDAPIDVYPPDPTLIDILGSLAGEVRMGVATGMAGSLIGGLLADVHVLLGARAAAHVAGVLDAVLAFRREPVQVLFVAPVR